MKNDDSLKRLKAMAEAIMKLQKAQDEEKAMEEAEDDDMDLVADMLMEIADLLSQAAELSAQAAALINGEDIEADYLLVRRAWHTESNRPIIMTDLKTKAARRDIAIPERLAECLREAKATSTSEYSNLIEDNPTKKLNAKGGIPKKVKEPLTDAQVKTLLDTIRGLPPYVFVMIGLYSGLRREEILGLQWDCVFLDAPAPYISVRRAWHEESNRPVINTELKTKSARRDVPIPQVLVDCLREEKEKSISEYVIADSEGQPLSYSQFVRIWNYIKVRSTGERTLYKYVNGQSIKKKVTLELGQQCRNKPSIVYTIDFPVTPHLLRHTYITNLIHAGVDPKTVQHLAGHKNSKVTMDIYAKVKYNKPEELSAVVNEALEK